jgi:hypothetical protein
LLLAFVYEEEMMGFPKHERETREREREREGEIEACPCLEK